jgi:hypothetical protein
LGTRPSNGKGTGRSCISQLQQQQKTDTEASAMVKKENNAAEDELLATNVKYAQEDK